jgi:hypothetical protein
LKAAPSKGQCPAFELRRLWFTLVAQVRPYLRRRGEKALLARVLGVDPSRIYEFFIRRTAAPDAERTLLLLQWLKAKQAGRSSG